MFEIVNHRYLKKLPTITSTEKTFEELLEIDEAVGSRFIEMSKAYLVCLVGKKLNYRIYGEQKMNILEEAENLRRLAEEAAKKRGITVQEAWNEAIEIFKSRNKLK